MVAWCCFVILPLTGVALVGAWLGLSLASPDDDDSGLSGLLIGGATLLGLSLFNLLMYFLVKTKASRVTKGEGFPESRSTIWSVLLGLFAGAFTIGIAWPLGWLLQTVVVQAIKPFVSEKTRLSVAGFIGVSSNQLFSVWLSPFWHVNVVRRPAGGVPEKTIIMPNHLSFSDPFVVSSALWPKDAKFAATSWLFKIPFGGWMLGPSGNLRIKLDKVDPATSGGRRFRPDKEVAKRSLETAERYVDQGTRVGVFPEGGISQDGGYTLKEFRNGFFKLAIEHGTSITPIAMWGAQTMWIHEAPLPQPGYAEVAIGDAIPVSKDDDIEELKEKVKNALLELRSSLPLFQKTQNYDHRVTMKV